MPDIESKLKEIMALVFKVPAESIHASSSQDDIENWDSIGTIMLITAIEEEFEIEIEQEDILEMLNFQLIQMKIEEKLNT